MKKTVAEFMQSVLQGKTNFRWEPKWDPTGLYSGIKALTYDALETEKGKTMAFAYVGIPENVEGPFPGVVLVHGGGGHAFLPWVKQWMDAGYAAIAMDNTGCFPTRLNAGDLVTFDNDYAYGLSSDFEREGYVSAIGFDSMENDTLPLEEQWMTHAMAQVIAARKVLASMPEVDENRIGMTGISWGGVIASLVISHDTNFAYAIPVYGSAYLDSGLAKLSTLSPANKINFCAEDGYSNIEMPILWLAWDDDNNFSIQSNCLSYLATKNNEKTCLSLIYGMRHGHYETWQDPHSIAYADWIMGRTDGFIIFETQPEGRNATAKIKLPPDAHAVMGKLYWISEPMSYGNRIKYPHQHEPFSVMEQDWHEELFIPIENGVMTAELPKEARGYYLHASFMRNGRRLVSTSVYVEI